MSVPPKYRAIGDFHEYYSGRRTAPYLTLFVGGNHEASSHLHELYYGGWVAPKIYYAGAANVLRFGDIRIAGLSGIWNGRNYREPHYERVPYTFSETRSIYHVREIDVRKLLLLRNPTDIGISHDWPRGIEWLGDHKALFRKKDLFEADAKAGTLGSIAAKYVLDRLRPTNWFSAHLHCKFAACVNHVDDPEKQAIGQQGSAEGISRYPFLEHHQDGIVASTNGESPGDPSKPAAEQSMSIKNTDEIDLQMFDDIDDDSELQPNIMVPSDGMPHQGGPNDTSTVPAELRSQLPASFARIQPTKRNVDPSSSLKLPHPPTIPNKQTNFLALDKCLPNRKFLQILNIDPPSASEPSNAAQFLSYDPEWLSILRVFAHHDPHQSSPPDLGEAEYMPLIAEERQWIEENLVLTDRLRIPENFEQTAPAYDNRDIRSVGTEQPIEYNNPQTKAFCELLGIPNWFHATGKERKEFRERKLAVVQSETHESRGRGKGGGRGRDRGRGRGGWRDRRGR